VGASCAGSRRGDALRVRDARCGVRGFAGGAAVRREAVPSFHKCGTAAHKRGVMQRWAMDLDGQGIYNPRVRPSDVRVAVFGSTGYIGRYVTKEFIRQGYKVTAFARQRSGVGGKKTTDDVKNDFEGASVVFGDVTSIDSVRTAFDSERQARGPLVVVSCLASRGGGIADSNLIDYQATLNTLRAGREAGASHFVLLSAICVQKPLLEFQRAKLRFEAELQKEAEADPSFSFSIVRPTAFFKSLAGQVSRLKNGSKYIYFGDGELCKCNAISEADLARFMALCVQDPKKRNAILPVGGPGEPVTPKQQAEMTFKLLGREPKYSSAPVALFDVIIGTLETIGRIIPAAREPAEFARIGRYYATEDMVGPSFGSDTLEQFFANVIENGLEGQELGDASIFDRPTAKNATQKK